MPTVYFGLGGNLGDRPANLRAARDRLQAGGVRIDRCSSLYETEPWGVPDQPPFLNAVCRGRSAYLLQELGWEANGHGGGEPAHHLAHLPLPLDFRGGEIVALGRRRRRV